MFDEWIKWKKTSDYSKIPADEISFLSKKEEKVIYSKDFIVPDFIPDREVVKIPSGKVIIQEF